MTTAQLCCHCLMARDIHQDLVLDGSGRCNYCSAYEAISPALRDRRSLEAALDGRLESAREEAARRGSRYDCLVPVSGGKDSSYLLLKVGRQRGMRILAVTAQTEFSDPRVLVNARRICRLLQVEHRVLPAWTEADRAFGRALFLAMGSLCPACLSGFAKLIGLAQDQGIPAVLIGDSRDQMFEGSPSLTKVGLRRGAGDNHLEYGRKGWWWEHNYLPLFELLKEAARHYMAPDCPHRRELADSFDRVARRPVPDLIPYYFFMGHDELQMIRELEAVGWVNHGRTLASHPDCRLHHPSLDPAEKARNLSVYVREGVLTREEGGQQMRLVIKGWLKQDLPAEMESLANQIKLESPGEIKGREWFRQGLADRRNRAISYLDRLGAAGL